MEVLGIGDTCALCGHGHHIPNPCCYTDSCQCGHSKNTRKARTAEERYTLTATCTGGHTQSMQYAGSPREFVESVAGLMDGSHPFYTVPVGPDSVIGKCGVCRMPIRCVVTESNQ